MSFQITDDDNSLSDYVDKPMAKDMEDYFGSKASELSNLLEQPIGPDDKKFVNEKLAKIGRTPLFVS